MPNKSQEIRRENAGAFPASQLRVSPVKIMKYNADIEGEVTYIPTEAGGRKKPALSGYRPQFYYNGHDWDAIQNYPDVDQVNPGDTVRVIFTFLSPGEHFEKIEPGTLFLIREGTRTVGYGKVTKILDLGKSAKAAAAKK